MKKILLPAAVAASALAVAAGASAKAGDVVVTGKCSGASTYKLKVNTPRDGGVQAQLEVDQNRNGVTWNVKLTDNGIAFFDGTATTKAPSGSFSVGATARDQAGTDTVVATATNPATGETCSATATV